MLWKFVRAALILFVVMVAGLVIGGMYIYKGGTPSCMFSGHNRFDWSPDGVNNTSRSSDGTAHRSIMDTILVPAGVKASSAFQRLTVLDNCSFSEDSAQRLSYVELRSPALSAAVQVWRAGKNNETGFSSWHVDTVLKPSAARGANGAPNMGWYLADARDDAPEWVDKALIGEDAFIALWGSGHLFKGKGKDDYLWVGHYP